MTAVPILTVTVTVAVGYHVVVDEQEISFLQAAVEHTRLDQLFFTITPMVGHMFYKVFVCTICIYVAVFALLSILTNKQPVCG